jgi:Cu(I)/Ag(I) efflux system membrane fusion protein
MEKHRQARPGNRVSRLFALGCASVAVFGLNTAVVHAESGARGTATEKFDGQMEPILSHYLGIGSALSSDSVDGVRKEAEAIAKLARGLDSGSVSGEHAARYKSVPANLEKAAQSLSKAQSLTAARDAFKDLSKPMAMWVSMSKPKNIDVVYCSMAKGSWVQKRGKKSNPYYGPKMLECGEVVGGDSYENPRR